MCIMHGILQHNTEINSHKIYWHHLFMCVKIFKINACFTVDAESANEKKKKKKITSFPGTSLFFLQNNLCSLAYKAILE